VDGEGFLIFDVLVILMMNSLLYSIPLSCYSCGFDFSYDFVNLVLLL